MAEDSLDWVVDKAVNFLFYNDFIIIFFTIIMCVCIYCLCAKIIIIISHFPDTSMFSNIARNDSTDAYIYSYSLEVNGKDLRSIAWDFNNFCQMELHCTFP